jgi:hypothetical protein
MPKGVKIQEIEFGTGAVAERHHTVVVNLRIFLNRGEELRSNHHPDYPRQVIDLHKRETIAGIRYGIEGMRVGGKRHFSIGPHLAYGADGIESTIPPNAVLRCEVELLEVRKAGNRTPDDFPPGKYLSVFHPGQAATEMPRWQFGLRENGDCGATITRANPEFGWRYVTSHHLSFHPDRELIDSLINEALGIPVGSAAECLATHQMWVDSSEPGNGISCDVATNTMCISIGIQERGTWLCYYSLKLDSSTWTNSRLCRTISEWLRPHLAGD